MTGYYSDKLSAERLLRCYELAPPRVVAYLEAEMRHVADRLGPPDVVLELGCGYGRVMEALATRARTVVGIDTSVASLRLGRYHLRRLPNCRLVQMDAVALGFGDRAFDLVACIQNGISAFQVNQRALIAESIRVTRPGGRVLLSSYSARFWPDRLDWFRLQSEHGLLGEIDWQATGDGVIVCKDGFRARTVSPEEFESLAAEFNVRPRIEEVDGSSIFCEIAV